MPLTSLQNTLLASFGDQNRIENDNSSIDNRLEGAVTPIHFCLSAILMRVLMMQSLSREKSLTKAASY
jgi:hypothetical protein